MEQAESNCILSRDGLKLNYFISNVDNPKALVCIYHGHGEHLGRFKKLMSWLNDHSIACIAFDQRGHGRSEGRRGHTPTFMHLLNDIEEGLKFSRSQFLEVPMFLMGHSLGGLMVINYMLRKPTLEVTGFIASAPWLRLAFEPPAWKETVGRMVANIVPTLALSSELDAHKLSRIPEVVKEYQEDELNHDRVTSRFFVEITAAGEYAIEHARQLKTPGLVYHGTGDAVISYDGTKAFAEQVPDLVNFQTLDGVYHEPHSDLGYEELFGTISDWVLVKAK